MLDCPRTVTAVLLASLSVLLLGGCQGNGNFSLLGYSTAPPYDPNIRSVYIPVAKSVAFHTSPYRGVEADLTQAIIDEFGRRRIPIRVVSDPTRADTELIVTIAQIQKMLYNRNQANLARDLDVRIDVEVVWRDLRDGRILSGSRDPGPNTEPTPFDPTLPQAVKQPQYAAAPWPVKIIGQGRVLPELGNSNATGMQDAIRDVAIKIADMMEKPW